MEGQRGLVERLDLLPYLLADKNNNNKTRRNTLCGQQLKTDISAS